jgi:hypothetical protein
MIRETETIIKEIISCDICKEEIEESCGTTLELSKKNLSIDLCSDCYDDLKKAIKKEEKIQRRYKQ